MMLVLASLLSLLPFSLTSFSIGPRHGKISASTPGLWSFFFFPPCFFKIEFLYSFGAHAGVGAHSYKVS